MANCERDAGIGGRGQTRKDKCTQPIESLPVASPTTEEAPTKRPSTVESMRDGQTVDTQDGSSEANNSPAIDAAPVIRRRMRNKANDGPGNAPAPQQASILRTSDGETELQNPEVRLQLKLRGLTVRWPWSQLLMAGVKTVEVRGYDMNYKNPNVLPSEELWLIETRGSPNASRNANPCDFSDMGSRPAKAQIVGTVIFSRAARYTDITSFRDDAWRHCIKEGGNKDWDGNGVRYAWHVKAVRTLKQPICGPPKTMAGIPIKRTYSLSFTTSTRESVDVIPDDISEGKVKKESAQDEDLDMSSPRPEDDDNYDTWRRLEELRELPEMDAAIDFRRLLKQRMKLQDNCRKIRDDCEK